jgi:saccharopine dehydrogenase-like NADP-dependent oxidoreductase
MVISAVPGFLGFKTLQAVLEAGKTAVDIAFFPKDPFVLDKLAKAKGLVAVVDCGVAPGMSSILAAHKGTRIRPLDFTAEILFPKWKLQEGEADITVMKIIVEGTKERKTLRISYDLFDRYDERTAIHSMARTTGYTATTAARMIAQGLYRRKGISEPEHIGADARCVKFMLSGLAERGVAYRENLERVES